MATHASISCLRNSMDKGVWWATVHGVAKSLCHLGQIYLSKKHFLEIIIPTSPVFFTRFILLLNKIRKVPHSEYGHVKC